MIRDQFLYLKILKLYSNGLDYQQIANRVGISTWRTKHILEQLNDRSKLELDNILSTELALHYKASVTLLKQIMAKCSEIVNETKDNRVSLMSLTLARDCMKDITTIYSQASAVSKAIDNSSKQTLQLREEHADGINVGFGVISHTSTSLKDGNHPRSS